MEQVNNSKFLSDAKTDSFYIAMCSEYFFFFVIEENIFSYVQFVSWKRWNTSLTKKK